MIRFLLSLVLLACLALPAAAQCGSRTVLVRGPWFPGKLIARSTMAALGYGVPPRWRRLDVVAPRAPRAPQAAQVRGARSYPQQNCPNGVCRMPVRY